MDTESSGLKRTETILLIFSKNPTFSVAYGIYQLSICAPVNCIILNIFWVSNDKLKGCTHLQKGRNHFQQLHIIINLLEMPLPAHWKKWIHRTEAPRDGKEWERDRERNKNRDRRRAQSSFLWIRDVRCCHGDMPLVGITVNAMCQRNACSCSKVIKRDHKTKALFSLQRLGQSALLAPFSEGVLCFHYFISVYQW